MRAILPVAFLMAFAVFAGCSGTSDSSSSPTEPQPQAPAWPVVYDAHGMRLQASAWPGPLPTVEQRYVANRTSGEPTIGVTARGTVLYPSISFDALPGTPAAGQLPRTFVYVSGDNGTTWTDRTPAIANAGPAAQPVSLDPYVYADPVTGRMFTLDLYVGCSNLSYSDDDGQTWTTNPVACGIPVNDHQTLASGPVLPPLVPNPVYPRVVYYCVNQLATSTCTHSLDGGLTWVGGQPAFGASTPQGDQAASTCGGLNGHVYASEVTGTVFLPAGCGHAEVARSTDLGMTWTDIIVDRTVGFDGHDGSVAVDANGTVYYYFLDGKALPRLSVSHDDGRTWATPLNVTIPGTTVGKFPAIAAGAAGRIAFLYVGSDTPHGQDYSARKNGQPMYPKEEANATWNAYIVFGAGADGPDPLFVGTMVNDATDPLARGNCDGRCYRGDNDGMFDFLDLQPHPKTGQVFASLVDQCTQKCGTAAGTSKDVYPGRGAVAVQTGGWTIGSRFASGVAAPASGVGVGLPFVAT